ncbi:hypothetical protein [Pararhizobium sp. PWRC1-1]|uniref:hypothetical protein n=1 Tax=Pararhizobium sp. PWRC1-1 TaxID=2804566 RepID=UPI003CFB9153
MRSRKSGKWNLGANENELERYFEGLESEELDGDDAQSEPSSQATVGLSTAEEIRRLTAYVAHLRERVSDLQEMPAPTSAQRPLSNSAAAIVGMMVMVGVASILRITARRLSRFG